MLELIFLAEPSEELLAPDCSLALEAFSRLLAPLRYSWRTYR